MSRSTQKTEKPRLLSEYSERRVRILKQFDSEWAWVHFSDLQKRIESCRSVSRAPIDRINMTGRAAAVMPLQLSRDLTFFWEMRMESIMAVPARMPPRIRTYFANARYRTVTASARVQDLSGLKVVAEVPVVIPFS